MLALPGTHMLVYHMCTLTPDVHPSAVGSLLLHGGFVAARVFVVGLLPSCGVSYFLQCPVLRSFQAFLSIMFPLCHIYSAYNTVFLLMCLMKSCYIYAIDLKPRNQLVAGCLQVEAKGNDGG